MRVECSGHTHIQRDVFQLYMCDGVDDSFRGLVSTKSDHVPYKNELVWPDKIVYMYISLHIWFAFDTLHMIHAKAYTHIHTHELPGSSTAHGIDRVTVESTICSTVGLPPTLTVLNGFGVYVAVPTRFVLIVYIYVMLQQTAFAQTATSIEGELLLGLMKLVFFARWIILGIAMLLVILYSTIGHNASLYTCNYSFTQKVYICSSNAFGSSLFNMLS